MTMEALTVRAARDGYLYYALGNSSGSSLVSHTFFTDNPGTRFPFTCTCIVHCAANTWYYPLFRNTNSNGTDSVTNVNLTVQLLQLD